jgi:hypothetical protein
MACSSEEQSALLSVHVLYARCRCSRRILQHLAAEPRPAGVTEKVLLVGANPELAPTVHALSARNFQIVATSPAELRDLPHFGCAVSRDLERLLDPLGLRARTP